jgi:hypothetical protein
MHPPGLTIIKFFALSLLLAACGGKSLQCVNQTTPDPQQSPLSNLQVELGVDGSGSMYGFVKSPGSRYSQAIDSLHTLLQTQRIPARYWRIGRGDTLSAPQELTSTQFLEARTPDFYCKETQSKFPCVTSTLDQIYTIAPPKLAEANTQAKSDKKSNPTTPNTLRILLTDLEPDSDAVGVLSGKISEELNTHLNYKAVLLGVRSEYDGKIFPATQGAFAEFKYVVQTHQVDQKGRPFYVLMTGPSEAVDAMVNALKKLPLDVSQAFRLSSFAIGGIDAITLNKTAIAQQVTPCVSQTGAINKARPRKDSEHQWLLLEQTCPEKQPLTLTIPSQKAAMLVGATELKPEMFKISDPALAITKISSTNNQITLDLQIASDQIPKRSGQSIYVTLQKRDLDQAIWKGWNTSVSSPDGAKTQNLMLFVSGLRGSVESVVQDPKQKESTLEAIKYCLGFTRKDR